MYSIDYKFGNDQEEFELEIKFEYMPEQYGDLNSSWEPSYVYDLEFIVHEYRLLNEDTGEIFIKMSDSNTDFDVVLISSINHDMILEKFNKLYNQDIQLQDEIGKVCLQFVEDKSDGYKYGVMDD